MNNVGSVVGENGNQYQNGIHMESDPLSNKVSDVEDVLPAIQNAISETDYDLSEKKISPLNQTIENGELSPVKEIAKLKEERKQLTTALEDVTVDYEKLHAKSTLIISRNTELEKQAELSKKIFEEQKIEFKNKFDQQTKKADEQFNQILKLKEFKTTLESEKNELSTKSDAISKKSKQRKDELLQVKSDKQELEKKYTHLEQSNILEIKKLRKEYTVLEVEGEAKAKLLINQSEEFAEKKSELEAALYKKEQICIWERQEVERLKLEKTSLNEKISTLTSQLEENQFQMTELKNKYNQLNEAHEQLQIENKQTTTSYNEAKKIIEKQEHSILDLEMDIKKKDNEMLKKLEELLRVDNSHGVILEEKRKLEIDKKDLQSKNEAITVQIQNLEIVKESLLQNIKNLKAEKSEINEKVNSEINEKVLKTDSTFGKLSSCTLF
jgi:chromosome segregation ATPase